MIEWILILNIQGVTVNGIGEPYYTQAECERDIPAWTKPGVSAYCLPTDIKPISVSPPHDPQPAKVTPGNLCDGMTAEECFDFGVAAGEGLPQ